MTYFILTLDHITVLYQLDDPVQVIKERDRVVITNDILMKTTSFNATEVNVVDWFVKAGGTIHLPCAYQLSEEAYHKILEEQLNNSVEKTHNYYDRTQPDEEL